MDFMYIVLYSIWIVMLLVQWTKSENYCDTDTQNPNNIIMETFEKPTEDLQCTARSENSVITELYHCVNGTGTLLDSCSRGQSTSTGRVSTSCTVTIGAENVSQTFYCIERMLFDRTNQLSAHYSVVVVSDTPLDGVVTVQTSSPTTTNAELATSDQSFTEEINDTNPRKNEGRLENMPEGVFLTVIAALISLLSTSFITFRDHYDCVIEDSSFYIHKNSKEKESGVSEEKQTFDAVPVQTHHKLVGKTKLEQT